MQRMFGSRNIPKVAKYATVIYIYTQNPDHQYISNSAEMKARRTTKIMLQKLYERLLKQPKYDNNRKYNDKFSDLIKHVINDGTNYKYFHVWMLEANQAVHELVHQFCEDYNPNDLESKKCDFYTEIFKELTT